MRLGEVGPQPDGFAEGGGHLGAARALAAEEAAQQVVRLGASGGRTDGLAERRGRRGPVRRRHRGRGEVQAGVELSERPVEIARAQVREARST